MSDLTPARLEALLAAATPGPWKQHLVDETLVVSGSHQIATTNIGGTYSQNFQRMAADAELLALSPALAARVIELEQERDALRLAGKHLALKLAEVYRMGKVSPSECQAMREWIALMPARAALEPDA